MQINTVLCHNTGHIYTLSAKNSLFQFELCTFLTYLNFFALPSQLNLFNFPPETDYSTNLTFRWISSFSSNIQLKLDGVKHLLIFSNIIVHCIEGQDFYMENDENCLQIQVDTMFIRKPRIPSFTYQTLQTVQ